MPYDLGQLLNKLQIQDPNLKKLQTRTAIALNQPKTLQAIIDQQCDNRKQVNCYPCESMGVCAALRGVAHMAMGDAIEAVRQLQDANQHFRGEDETWNSIIGLELLGMAYEYVKPHQATLVYKQALEILENRYIPTHKTDYKNDGQALRRDLLSRITGTAPEKIRKAPSSSTQPVLLTLPWMPVYSTIQAGPNGPIWSDPLQSGSEAEVDKIVLDGTVHSFHSLSKGDSTITLVNDKNKEYGWAKVEGDSMSAARPVPIEQGDFVLFFKCGGAVNSDIVVASCPDEETGAGYKHIVKRYDKADQHLYSETNPPDLYEPIPITKEIQILGTVIAVAKPV
jgi:hypothetical protein